MTLGLLQYGPGRRHLAGRTHAAEFALAVAAGLVVIAMAPWPRRTMHPVH
ncbi:hypothetical protein [Streptomyces sp. NPDC001774]